jgi:hypothetical protein
MSDKPGQSENTPPKNRTPLLLYGVLLICLGNFAYFLGVMLGLPRYILSLSELRKVQEVLVWYSGIPLLLGISMVLVDLFVLFDRKRTGYSLKTVALANPRVTVALTAYNDEASITPSVLDFLSQPLVARVIVVSNNSVDQTFSRATEAGALTFNELAPGYGRCVYRCLQEAVQFEDTELIVLCEGDMTFRAMDIDKLLAYAGHADIVNGTRTSEPLREHATQLSTFMYYGNVFVGKLLEAKHLGRGTFTDVGTTYKLCHRDALKKLLPLLNPAINLEFNAHFLDTALENDVVLVECPITFHAREGISKGGNVNNWRGFIVGLKMIRGIVLGWQRRRP